MLPIPYELPRETCFGIGHEVLGSARRSRIDGDFFICDVLTDVLFVAGIIERDRYSLQGSSFECLISKVP